MINNSQDMQQLPKVYSLKLDIIPQFSEKNGKLIVLQNTTNVPFLISRIFTVIAPLNSIRGQHSHISCSQYLFCPNGAIEVVCWDGIDFRKFILDQSNYGLFIPPGIWAEQKYLSENSVLNVLCDKDYDDSDYIRDRNDFLKYRLTSTNNNK